MFLPTIDAINERCKVASMEASETDYRKIKAGNSAGAEPK